MTGICLLHLIQTKINFIPAQGLMFNIRKNLLSISRNYFLSWLTYKMYFSTSLENVGSMSRVLNKMIPNQLIAIINYDTMHQDPKWTDFIVITVYQCIAAFETFHFNLLLSVLSAKWKFSIFYCDVLWLRLHYTAKNHCPIMYHKVKVGLIIQHPWKL